MNSKVIIVAIFFEIGSKILPSQNTKTIKYIWKGPATGVCTMEKN